MTDEHDKPNPSDAREVAERWGLALSEIDWQGLVEALAKKVEVMLLGDQRKLMDALYRLDVSETKTRQVLAYERDLTAQSHALAKLILKRELEKAEYRRKYSKPDPV